MGCMPICNYIAYLAMHVQENRKEFNFEGFTAYLRTPAGGKRNKATAKSITSDLIMFLIQHHNPAQTLQTTLTAYSKKQI